MGSNMLWNTPDVSTSWAGFGHTMYTITQSIGRIAPNARIHFRRRASSCFTIPVTEATSVKRRHLVALEIKNVENNTEMAPIRKNHWAYPLKTGAYITDNVRIRSCFSGTIPNLPNTAAPRR